MNAIAQTQRSIEAVNDMLQMASAETIKAAAKMIKVDVGMQVQTAGGQISADAVDTYA